MNEEEKKTNPESDQRIEQKVMPWRFWFSLVFSLFLIVTFVYYLPLRFQFQGMEHGQMMAEEMAHMEGMEGMEDMKHEAGHEAVYHEESEVRQGLAVNLNVTPVPFTTGVPLRLDFFVNEKPGNVPVPASDLQIEHAKLMHVIGVRNDMNEFFHIHPAVTETDGVLSVEHTFAKPGLYKIWSEIKKDGVVHSFGHPELAVQGQGPTSEKQVSFGRNAIAGSYQVSFKVDEPIAKGHEHDLSFDIHTIAGDEVEVEPYLGADMHLTIIKDDWKQFIHTHPEGDDHHAYYDNDDYDSDLYSYIRTNSLFVKLASAHGEEEIPGAVHDEMGADEAINFHVTFPESGLYKAFAQFRPKGIDLPPDEALLVSFWLQVVDKKPSAVPIKFWLVLVSAVLIVVLSVKVKKYISVKAS